MHDGPRMRIGISGWSYGSWRGVFYPKGLRQKDELAYAAAIFSAIEINGTFYSLQRPQSFLQWAGATPDRFQFAIKGPRYITHMLRLKNVELALANFLASGVLALGQKLGPIVWQFPANFQFDAARFEAFLELLPKDTAAAAKLAGKHDARLDGRDWTKADARRRLRHAFEIRNASFDCPAFMALLRRHNAALVVADAVGWPRLMEVTADFVYCRLHGSKELYSSGYGPAALRRWADRAFEWAGAGDDVFVFFDNDAKVEAPFNAGALQRALDRRCASANSPKVAKRKSKRGK